ncbi:MAG: integrase core domain-containing protein [Solirubrobacteraceae bacterium]
MRGPVEPAQYTSEDYTQQLDDAHVLASVGTVGDAYDNALAESFVDSFKTELIADRVWRTHAQLELAVVEYVAWFNHVRLHSSLGNRPPAGTNSDTPSRHGSNRLRSSAPPLQPLLRPVYDPSGVVSEIRFKNRLADNC